MRHIGLVAFGTTLGILVPAAAIQLTAGPVQRAKLFAPDSQSLQIGDNHVAVSIDRRFVDAGEKVRVKLVADKRVTLGIVVLGSNGSEGERVPEPPVAVAHREVTLEPDWTGHASAEIPIALTGATARSYDPLGTYSIYVMSRRAADRFYWVADHAEPTIPTGEIPMPGPGDERLWDLKRALDQSKDPEGKRDAALFPAGSVARVQAYTRPADKHIAIAAPETAVANQAFTVRVSVTNPSARKERLRLDLSFPSIDESYLGLKEDGVSLEEKPVELELAKGETKTVELHVTGKQPGVLGMQAKVECVEREYDSSKDDDYKKAMTERYSCERRIDGMGIGTFEAVEILAPSREAPTKTFAAK